MAKQSGGNTAQRVEALVRPVVEGMGLRLWDVVFEKEGPDWYLRVLIDKDGTMDTDTCAEVSHALDPILDEADPIDQSYYLEVGSPGLGRRLTRPEHYEALTNNEFFEALSMLEHERGITAEYLIEKIKAAIVIAVKKNYEVEDDHVMVEIDPDTGKFNVALIQDVVADEDWYDEHSEIGITEAQHIRKSYQVGDRVVTPLKTKDFGRIAAQTAKHVIRQGIREAERSQQLSEIQSRAHDIVQATVTRVDPEKGIVALDLGKGGEAILPRNEQVPGEVYTEGQMLQVYIVDVVASERGPRVMISRTHPGLVKRLFELEVPEIYDGTVEVKAISREAGARTKMAVWSKDANVNPVSACIGPHGDRVAAVVEKLGGEKIDIVKWSEDISEFISAALSPAKVVKVELLPGETRSCRVTVPDQQLSLAIGNKGQNARLCARLTGYNIDIRPESGYYGEEEPKAAEAEKTEDTAAE